MPKLLVLAALSLVPLTAAADDDPLAPAATDPGPVAEDPAQPAAEDPALAPPSSVEPVAAPAPVYEHPCAHGWYRHGGPRRGFIGIGFAKGHMELDDESEGKQKSLIVRAQGRRGFGIELEWARAQLGDDGAVGNDTAKSFGGSLYKAFGRRRLMPYVLAGGGRGVIERASGAEDHMRYGEFGGGLMLKLRRFAFGVDFRRGVRRLDDRAPVAAPAMDTASSVVVTPTEDDRARYVRGRVMALITF